MKLSIVIAVLDSHGAMKRQMQFFAAMPLPEDVELVIVDDGSDPPLGAWCASLPSNVRVLRHDLDAQWTQPAARNYGVSEARGERLIVTDLDHIIPLDTILAVRDDPWDATMFRREIAVLDECGRLVQDRDTVLAYGYQSSRYSNTGFTVAPHVNSFGMDRQLWLRLGGMDERQVGTGDYPNHDDGRLRRRLLQAANRGEIRYRPVDDWPLIYMFPVGKYAGDVDHNPFGLFHNLSRKTADNRQWRWQQEGKFAR